MAEGDQAAEAAQKVDRQRGDGKDHHAREQAEQIGFGAKGGGDRRGGQDHENRDRQPFDFGAVGGRSGGEA